MKRRNGFVSNSSSSSFVIGIEKLPESIETCAKDFFGDESTSVCEDDVNSLFRNLVQVKIDFDRIMALPIKGRYLCDANDLCCNDCGQDDCPDCPDCPDCNDYTKVLFREIFINFTWGEEYGWRGYWSSRKDTEYDKFVNARLAEYDAAGGDDAGRWKVSFQASDDYFKQEHIDAKFRVYLAEQIAELKKFPVHMQTEYGDDCNGHMEHEFNWGLFPAHKVFSHH